MCEEAILPQKGFLFMHTKLLVKQYNNVKANNRFTYVATV